MIADAKAKTTATPVVLFLDGDILIRMAVSAYLRDCGFTVIETGSVDEARLVFEAEARVDVAFLDVDGAASADRFAFAQRLRREHPEVKVILASGVQRTAAEAGELCEHGPMLAKPYDHGVLERHIRRLLAQ